MNNVGTQLFETENLILRRFEIADLKSVFENWASVEEVQRNYGEPVYSTKEATLKLLEKYIENYKNENVYRWAIILKESNVCIGQIAYFLVDNKNNFAEIEYCIGSKFQRNGFATEATKAVIEYGFNKIGLHKVQICHRENNIPSRKVIEKCGFHFDGSLRDYFLIDGEYHDRLYYSILENEF